MTEKLTRLELTWPGKEDRFNPEPRILLEDKEKSFSFEPTEKGSVEPTYDNMLIHGDNLLALKALEQDYTGRIKCICIDPPYNTWSAFDSYEDGLEHSIWLSLMRDRLEILKRLLAEDGSIWISIDDNEQAYLKILCDEIFGVNNFLANLPTIMNLKGNQDQFGFAGTHEYTIVFAKNKPKLMFNSFPVNEEEVLAEWQEDEIGYYKKGATLKRTGLDAPREKRPYGYYPILISSNDIVSSVTSEEFSKIYDKATKTFNDVFVEQLKTKYTNLGFTVLLPEIGSEKASWRWSYEKVLSDNDEIIVSRQKQEVSLYKKQRPEIGDIPTKKPKSLFYKPEYSSGNGTAQIKKLFGEKAFSYPKPEELICDFLTLATNPGDLVLDSFLGSGTTAAVAHKMGRRWIGIEMGDQCYNLCAPRLQKVIKGEDSGGVTKSTGWLCGGGFKFYELASSLIVKDKYGQQIISDKYNADMLAEAMCKILGYHYKPDAEKYWKQGFSSEKSFIFTTTMSVQEESLDKLAAEVGDNNLLICCSAFVGNKNAYPNITVKKIPSAILKKCEWGREGYPLNLSKYTPKDEDFEFEEEE